MIKRTIEISQLPAHVTVQHAQLVLKRDGEVVGQAPCEDIGVVLVDQPGVTYSHAALAALAESDAALVVCGRNHLPVAVLLPLADHSQVVWRVNEQLGCSRPLKKQLWKQLIQAKIRGQAENLAAGSETRAEPRSRHPHPGPLPRGEGDGGQRAARSKLLDYARQVRSGDASNLEAQAARVYWQNWLPEEAFRRDADGDGLNSLLNYGYAVVRAAVARAIVAAGLLPSLGLKHSNRSNAFCLADDLIEPLRPLVDDRARELYRQGCTRLDAEGKAGLLKLLAEDVSLAGETGPLMVCLHRYVASLVKCFQGEAKQLEIPEAVDAAVVVESEAAESRGDGLKPSLVAGKPHE